MLDGIVTVIQLKLGYTFIEPHLVLIALNMHGASRKKTQKGKARLNTTQRKLAFLGDSLLRVVTAESKLWSLPNSYTLHSQVLNSNRNLALVGQKIVEELPHLEERTSVASLAGLAEALIGAVWMDCRDMLLVKGTIDKLLALWKPN